jgi:hypothetical protein
MNSLTLLRILATLGVALAIAFVILDVWVGIEFKRVYFPDARHHNDQVS